MNDQPEVDWVESRQRPTRPAPSSEPVVDLMAALRDSVDRARERARNAPVPPAPGSDTPSDERVQMVEVRPGEVRPMLDGLYDVTLPAGERPGLTLREAAIEAILIREQDTAFSTVARHIAALFTSLDAIPSAPPVPSEGERRPYMQPSAVVDALEAMSATLPNITGTQAVQLLVAADYVRLHIAAAADREEPT